MTFREAAVAVLEKAREPLTSDEITQRALRRGLLSTQGKTPEASMSAALYQEANSTSPRVRKISRPGALRAVRGSVRWTLAGRE